MEENLPTAVAAGLKAARRQSLKGGDRLCVHDGDAVYRIRRFFAGGMELDADVCDVVRGRVDIYDGARHLYQALIQGSEVQGDVCVFTFKWLQAIRSGPAADYERTAPQVSGLIGTVASGGAMRP